MGEDRGVSVDARRGREAQGLSPGPLASGASATTGGREVSVEVRDVVRVVLGDNRTAHVRAEVDPGRLAQLGIALSRIGWTPVYAAPVSRSAETSRDRDGLPNGERERQTNPRQHRR